MKAVPFSALIAAFLAVLPVSVALACSSDGREGIFPENTLSIPDSRFGVFPVSKDQFRVVVEKARHTFEKTLVKSPLTVAIFADWDSPAVKASTERSGALAKLTLSGGLARYPRMTADGLTLVLCHELGHHLGGAPKKRGLFLTETWISNEGQADYYSALKCARVIWRDEDNEALMERVPTPTGVIERCQKAFDRADEIALCKRTALAGRAVAETFAEIEGTPSVGFDHSDGSAVDITLEAHPRAQCRLDTFFAGAVCAKSEKVPLSDSSPRVGTCNEENGDNLGMRPRCWYRPADY